MRERLMCELARYVHTDVSVCDMFTWVRENTWECLLVYMLVDVVYQEEREWF